MTPEELILAMDALTQAYPYVPMSGVARRQFERLFAAYKVETLRAVLDDLILNGGPRPGPAELGGLLRSKAGRPDPNRGYVQRPGPMLFDVWDGPAVPANEPGWLEAAARAKAALRPDPAGAQP
jgi:hypothetical protein